MHPAPANMRSLMVEAQVVIEALAALAERHRLAIWRLLVHAGNRGMRADALGEAVGLDRPLRSYHLGRLRQAGLIGATRQGKGVTYSAHVEMIDTLSGYLIETNEPPCDASSEQVLHAAGQAEGVGRRAKFKAIAR